MWRRDKNNWKHSAPILFPIIGPLKNNQYNFEGMVYSLGQHGFARNSMFEVVELEKNHVVLRLSSNKKTLEMYPFHFCLNVTFSLINSSLKVSYQVINNGDNNLYFQIGGHPAFACPLYSYESYNDYYIEFEREEEIIIKIMDKEKRGMSHVEEKFFDLEKRFFVRQALFERNAIIFQNCKSSYVSLKSINHNKEVRVHFKDYPYLGVWAGKRAGGLLTIEPWHGHGDYIDFFG